MSKSTASTEQRIVVAATVSALAVSAIAAGVLLTGAWFSSTASAEVTAPGGTLALGAFGDNAEGIVEVVNVKPLSEAQALDPNNSFGAAEGQIVIDNTGTVAMSWDAEISAIESSLYLWPETLYIAVQDEGTGTWTAHDASDLFENEVPLEVGSGAELDAETTYTLPIRVYLREGWEPPFAGWSEAWGPTFTVSAQAQQAIAP
ncbi:hypothetical protein FHX49_002004 [Microbacterium endophyticum]|uniref:Uncharacterized protein n=1 Tax=Microbacterium endophyticum TaxID=1526412 RepID=A0A7W4V4L7_9MICO|nr:hypothetical protein [Microbacterium endophyticum]MBB2976429.1 hypothetical protein [Microbacterium endophyticum]NIK35875.1 hypothetical protein [Microbacterium endophyticum]